MDEKNKVAKIYYAALSLINATEKYLDLCYKAQKPGLSFGNDDSGLFNLADPNRIVKDLKEYIIRMDEETRDLVFDQIARISEKTKKEIEEKDKPYIYSGNKTIKACEKLYTLRSEIEKEKETESDRSL